VERSFADDATDIHGSSDVALADLPSTSGAHWAHRDEILHRPAPEAPAPFRRPPAVNSFLPEDGAPSQQTDGWDAFAPSDNSRGNEAVWEAFGEPAKVDTGAVPSGDVPDAAAPPQAVAPAPTGTSSRASFGVTDEPIGGFRSAPTSPAGPAAGWSQADSAAGWSQADSAAGWSQADSAAGWPQAEPAAGWPSADAAAGWPQDAPDQAPGWPDPDTDAPAGWPVDASSSAAEPPLGGAGIGEFLNGPGREIRPHRAGRRDHAATGGGQHEPAPPRGTPAAAPRRSRVVMIATVALSTVVLLAGAVAGVVFFAGPDSDLTEVLRLGAGDADDQVATAPLAGRTAASFEMAAATTKVTVRTQDLGEDLYRITAAGESGTVPQPVVNEGRVELQLSSEGDRVSGTVEVLLSAKVTWSLRFDGAADEQIIDLTGGRVSSVDLAGGTRRVDLKLARPSGTVPVRVTGAIDDLSVTSPAGNPVRVQVGGGAKTVTAGQRTLRDLRPGSTLTPKDWAVPDRYDVDAAARLTLLSVRSS
jgi:hypothetical protein